MKKTHCQLCQYKDSKDIYAKAVDDAVNTDEFMLFSKDNDFNEVNVWCRTVLLQKPFTYNFTVAGKEKLVKTGIKELNVDFSCFKIGITGCHVYFLGKEHWLRLILNKNGNVSDVCSR